MKIKTILSIFLVIAAFSLKAQSPDSLMKVANNAYNQGLYDSAINVYNSILQKKMESPQLYYNLGNAWFKKGEIPHAILFYEKAKKLAPNDEDITYNLGVANSMIVDKIEKVPQLFFEKWWDYFYDLLNADNWAIIFLILWSLLIFLAGLFFITKSRNIKKTSFYIGILILILTFLSFGLASQKHKHAVSHNEAIVFTPTLTVKSSPTQTAVDLFVLHEGTKVKVLDQVDGWVKIKIPNGSVGWIPEKSIEKI
jgi:tetratricopeptide (TPR) repeat protein